MDEGFDVGDDEDYLNEPDDVSHGVSNATPMQNTVKRQQQVRVLREERSDELRAGSRAK